MVAELLAAWGVKAAWSAFGPVLEDLAKDVAKDAAKSYVGKCFGSVFSSKSDKTLIKATGQMIKELLDLLEYELGLDEDREREELISMQRAATAFLKQEPVQQVIVSLLKEPNYQLDAAVLAQAWQGVQDAPVLPEDFSWLRISKRFSKKAKEIRDSIPELKAIFAQNLAMKANEALASSIGPQPDFDLDRYSEALKERFGRLNLDCLDTAGAAYNAVRLWSVFVPQSVRECEKFQPRHLEQPKGEEEQQEQLRSYFEQPPRPVLEVCADPQLQRLVILGDPGSGKSTLLRCLALEWARDEDATRRAVALLPLLIELRDYNQWECPSGKSFTAYLHHARNWHRLNQQHLNELLQTPGRVLLLLDGLDEIFDPQQRELAVNDIFRFSNDYPDARIVLTSRVVGYKPERLRDAGFRHFKLEDFDEKQIEEFLKLWHQITFSDQEEAERKRQRLAKAIADSRPIKLLAGNPLLLTLMAVINRNQELPRNRARLYEKAAELLLQQWDTERHLRDFPGLSAEIDLRAKAAILRKVALEMQTAGSKAANLIQGEKLIKLIEEYLLTELRFTQARAAAKALVDQLRQRNFILCFLGGDSYGFVHRTFLEYFCAAEFVDQFKERQTLKIDDLLALYDAHCREDDWQEVLRLICGQVDEQFAGKIIAHLTERVDLDQWDKETELPELLLAVWCLSEIRNLNKIEEKIGGDLLLKTIDCFLQNEETSTAEELFQPVESIGVNWPGKFTFHFDGQIPVKGLNKIWWPYFLVIVFQQRQWIEQLCHVDFETVRVRSSALRCLAEHWPDEETRQCCRQAVDDEHENVRSSALRCLAEHWPEEETRQLCRQAVDDEHENVRRSALRCLAEHWPEEETRQLCRQAVDDEHENVRRNALEVLAEHWPDEETRQCCRQAVDDEHEDVRSSALRCLAEHWPDEDEDTRQLFKKSIPAVGIAAFWHGKEHSCFGKIVFWRFPDFGSKYFLNPCQPIPSEHIQKSAKVAGIPPDEIDETVRSLSAHMGWDITKGSLAGKL